MQHFLKNQPALSVAHPKYILRFYLPFNWWYQNADVWQDENWAAELEKYENWLKEL